MLILPEGWDQADQLVAAVAAAMEAAPPSGLYYPGAGGRLADFEGHGENVRKLELPGAVIATARAGADDYFERTEVFAPAMSVTRIAGPDAKQYLRAAIHHANEKLAGTLGANIIIHPSTIRDIGRAEFETILAELRYGIIAINSWSGFAFSLFQAPWGAFPGHTQQDVGSGIGVVHNGLMFERSERTVVEAPFRVFPKPAWFVGHKKAGVIGRLLTAFVHRPSVAKLPRILWNALSG
jgi:aldehyde dehydrogenase (NAD(P)+)